MAGAYGTENGLLVLQGNEGGTMPGQIAWQGSDRFTFKLPGGPADDKGLLFSR